MDVETAARSLGLAASTVRNQLEKGVMLGTKSLGYWEVTEAEVERYRRNHRGKRSRTWTPLAIENRLAALQSPEARAKMRAAKLGRPQSAEHKAKRAATAVGRPLSEEHRAKIAAAQTGKELDPDHLASLRAYHRTRRGKPLPASTRAKLAAAQVKAYEEGRRPYSPLENRAAEVLVPLGFERSVLIDGHAFDFGRGEFLVEVNGCHWHDHRSIKPECPIRVRRTSNARDEERRDIARANDRVLVELWECEEAEWPTAIAFIG